MVGFIFAIAVLLWVYGVHAYADASHLVHDNLQFCF